MSSETIRVITVHLKLEGEPKKKADKLREFYGVESYTELFRILLAEAHRSNNENGDGH